jgi:hypothetical protein
MPRACSIRHTDPAFSLLVYTHAVKRRQRLEGAELAEFNRAIEWAEWALKGTNLAGQPEAIPVETTSPGARTVTRPAMRMAIGQLADYARLIEARPARVVLMPEEPRTDLLNLAASQGIQVTWPDEESFLSSPSALHLAAAEGGHGG